MKKVRLISLDLETSGLDPAKHRPLAIGAVDIETGVDYYVGLEWDELSVSTQAMRVNRIDLTASKPGESWHLSRDPLRTLPATEAIAEFGQWLGRRKQPDEEIRALGKNPGSFDLPLLRPTWEEFWEDHAIFQGFPFSHRCVDLNSIFTAIACAKELDIRDVRANITKRAWHDFSQSTDKANHKGTFAELFQKLEMVGGAEHHALGDAWWNVHAWKRCLIAIKDDASFGCSLPSTQTRHGDMQCPNCKGDKEIMGMFAIRSDGSGCDPCRMFPCSMCRGSGAVPEEMRTWMEAGAKLKADRLARNNTLRQEAEARNLRPSELSALERGMVDPNKA